MNFTDEIFLLFLVSLFVLYYIVPLLLRPYLLLMFSVMFYISWGPEKLLIVLGAVAVTYLMGLWIARSRRIGKEKKIKKAGKPILTAAVLLLLGCLVWVKAGSSMLTVLRQHFTDVPSFSIIVPLGISYYTLTLTGYLMDVYYGRIQAEKNFFRLLSFAIFFPGILQGPFSRYKDLSPQLWEGHRFDYRQVCFGAQLMIYGYFKKLVIADRLAMYTGTVFNGTSYESYSGAVILVGLVFRSLQLYCDFSGFMDIAGGLSEMFGIKLAKNFNHPFFAKSAAEFWRRWHITLGTWFKDYVYMPLMTSPRVMKCSRFVKKMFGMRAGKSVMTLIPVYVVWLLTGLWHGTGWGYVWWGVYWGSIIAFSTVFAPEIKKFNQLLHINTEAVSWKVFQMVRTFCLFTVGRWITLDHPIALVKHMIRDFQPVQLVNGTLYSVGMDRQNFILVLVMLGLVWFISLQQEKGSVREQVASFNIVFRWLLYYGAILSVIIFGVYGLGYDAASFIYMQF